MRKDGILANDLLCLSVYPSDIHHFCMFVMFACLHFCEVCMFVRFYVCEVCAFLRLLCLSFYVCECLFSVPFILSMF